MAPLLRLSSVSMSTTMEIAFGHSIFVRLLLLESQGGASLSEASPDSIDRWNQYTKLGPFFLLLLLTVTFNQTTIKHSLYTRHYPGHFGEFSGFSMMNFYTTTHSITTNVIDLERTRQAASYGTPMSTLKMKVQGIMTLQTYVKKFR